MKVREQNLHSNVPSYTSLLEDDDESAGRVDVVEPEEDTISSDVLGCVLIFLCACL